MIGAGLGIVAGAIVAGIVIFLMSRSSPPPPPQLPAQPAPETEVGSLAGQLAESQPGGPNFALIPGPAPRPRRPVAPAPAEASAAGSPRAEIESVAASAPGRMAVTLVDPNGNIVADVAGDSPKPAASIIKLCIAVDMLHMVDEQRWTLETPVSGAGAPLRERLAKMVTASDNAATNDLIEAVGLSALDEEMHGWMGLSPGTCLRRKMLDEAAKSEGRDNLLTTRDVAGLLYDLATGQLLSADSSQLLLGMLLQQTRRSKIPAGLPEGTKVGNKTGELPDVQNDAAVIWDPGGRRWVLVVAVSDVHDGDAAQAAIASVARAAWRVIAAR